MEMEIKSAKDENIRNHVPFVKQLSIDSNKMKTADYSSKGGLPPPYAPASQQKYLLMQVSYLTDLWFT